MNAKQALLLALKALRDEGPDHLRFGICSNVDTKLCARSLSTSYEIDVEMYRTFAKWPKFTGQEQYPVPHPHLVPHLAYGEPDIWEGEYGDNRKELLNFMIAELEKDTE